MNHQKDIWIFPVDDQVAFFDGEKVHFPLPFKLRSDTRAIYQGDVQSWNDFLPDECIKKLSLFLESENTNSLFLHVHDKLEKIWKDYPWEYLKLKGKSLKGKMAIERDRKIQIASDLDPVFINPDADSLFLNMFPENDLTDKKFPYAKINDNKLQILSSYKTCINRCETQDISSLGLLVVFIHGSEQTDELNPFYLPDDFKTPWELPDVSLPPLVILLSCGDDIGNLSNYSRKLLKKGAKTVLSAVGQINSKQILTFFEGFFQSWKNKEPLSDILRRYQGESSQNNGALRLRIFGRGDICLTPERLNYNEKDSQHLARNIVDNLIKTKELDPFGIQLLLKRSMLSQFLVGKPWELVLKSWMNTETFRLDSNLFLQAIHTLVKNFSPLVKCWLYPFLIALSEKEDHRLMDELEDEYSLYKGNCQDRAVTLYNSSLFYYRNGMYREAINNFVLAKEQNDWYSYKSHFYRLALSISTDLLLASLGEIFEMELENALDELPEEFIKNESWSALDVQSRYYLRQGDFKKAYGNMRKKLRTSVKNSSNREKSWLLYISSLGLLPEAKADADIILEEIGTFGKMLECWHMGNTDIAYQIRALSLWCLQYEEKEIAKDLLHVLLKTVTILLKEDKIRDYAPIGFSLVFLKVTVASTPGNFDDIWEEVSVHMKNSKYYAELMGLYAILNDKENALKTLKRFHTFRRNMLKPLIYNNDISKIDYVTFFQNKENIESENLNNLPKELRSCIKCLINTQMMPQ